MSECYFLVKANNPYQKKIIDVYHLEDIDGTIKISGDGSQYYRPMKKNFIFVKMDCSFETGQNYKLIRNYDENNNLVSMTYYTIDFETDLGLDAETINNISNSDIEVDIIPGLHNIDIIDEHFEEY